MSPATAPPDGQAAAVDQQPVIRLEGITKRFGNVSAVEEVDLSIRRGEIFVILGGSGCGKSTLLRMLAGFEKPTRGRILIDGIDMTETPPYERPVNMMFQSYAVFPHMNVEQNIAYGLKKEGLARAAIAERVAEMLSLVQLESLARRKPDQLSGGQRQRVALARALIKRPQVLLLDEPLAALDKKLREHTQFELMNIQYQLGTTFLVVTHDQEEAMTLASRIAVMDRGRLVQVDTPLRVYEYPVNRFVADFVGTTNMFECRVSECGNGRLLLDCTQTATQFEAREIEDLAHGDRIWVAVRPEKIRISKEVPEDDGHCVLAGVVEDFAYYGGQSLYRVRCASGHMLQVSAQNRIRAAERVLEWDQQVYLSWDRGSSVVLRE